MDCYLDSAATTAVLPCAAAALTAALCDFGNPSSRHALGQKAAATLKANRETLCAALGCSPEEFIFTSGGTESDNFAIFAALDHGKRRGKHLITSTIEHAAILEPLKRLEQQGYEVTYLKPDKSGHIIPADLQAALRPDTIFVSLMLVNNELGTIQPVADCARMAHRYSKDIWVHCDGVQGFLKMPFTVKDLDVDLMSVSGHKIGAPKGIGGLYIRKGLRLTPLLPGGGQEQNLRSGTEPTAMIAAFAAAVEDGFSHRAAHIAHMEQLRDYAKAQLSQMEGVKLLPGGDAPHILPLSLTGYKSEVVVRFLSDRGVYLSSGSACHRGKASHVFAALDLPKSQRDGALRISFSPTTTLAEVDAFLAGLTAARDGLFQTMS
ncbi:MAG: cysteine desulfurase family protein [Oscillospiraceae bacterium]